MKKSTYTTCILLMVSLHIAAFSCTAQNVVKETRDAKNFTNIHLSISANIYLEQGKQFSVVVEAPKDQLEIIETVVEGNSLRIKTPRGVRLFSSSKDIKVYITMPTIQGLKISGSGDIISTSPLRCDDLDIEISGSGDIRFPNITMSGLKARLSGSGDIKMGGKGNAKDVNLAVSGSGDIAVDGIMFANADVSVSGSGNISLNVAEHLRGRVSGSGDILYGGNPTVDVRVSGSGKIRSRK